MISVEWNGKMGFRADVGEGRGLILDSHAEFGGEGLGPTPVEALLSSVAACSGMDVISILRKKQQKVTSYKIEVEGVRAPEGEWPRPFLSMTVRHIVAGEDLDPAAVERAVELSDGKYCSVIATLRQAPAIASEWRIDRA